MSESPALPPSLEPLPWLERLKSQDTPFQNAAELLEQLAAHGVGFGEVLRDYARQSAGQMRALLSIAQKPQGSSCVAEEWDVLVNAHHICKAAKTVLEMTPSAMARNKALALNDAWSRAAVEELAQRFSRAPEVRLLLASEFSGSELAERLFTPPV